MGSKVYVGPLFLLLAVHCILLGGTGESNAQPLPNLELCSGTCLTPFGTALDPTTGDLWVGDSGSSHILNFGQSSGLTSGSQPIQVIGNGQGGAGKLNGPTSIVFDPKGNLWVADFGNNRVLRYDHAASKPNDGATADCILGQPRFDGSNNPETSARGMSGPTGLYIDDAGTLWVVDRGNNRVLWFHNASSLANGSAADGVLGQETFTTDNVNCSASGFNTPENIFGTSNGDLFVTDWFNFRVVRSLS